MHCKTVRTCVDASFSRCHKSRTRTLPPPSNWCGTPSTPKHFTNVLRGRDSGFWVCVCGGDKGATPRVRCPQAEWHTQLCKHRVPQHAASSTSCPNACKKSTAPKPTKTARCILYESPRAARTREKSAPRTKTHQNHTLYTLRIPPSCTNS